MLHSVVEFRMETAVGCSDRSFVSMSPSPESIAFSKAIAANDARIRLPNLEDGREITAERTAIYTSSVARWAEERADGVSLPFGVAAVGGTGRQELTPCSDLDIVFLFEEPVETGETRRFLGKLQEETLHTRAFRDRFGFSLRALPYSFEDVPYLREKNLNSFLDLTPIYDPLDLCGEFRRRIRESYDPFEHFLHVRKLWMRQLERPGASAERVDRFDLKNDALRVFLAAIWTLGGREFEHSHCIYARYFENDSRDLDAYFFLIRLRTWLHLQRPGGGVSTVLGTHAEDTMVFSDFESFVHWQPEEKSERERYDFACEVQERLLASRRRVAAFSRGVIEGELRPGRQVAPGNPVALGAGGLHHTDPDACVSAHQCSRAALSLVLTAQRYGLQIDPSELQMTFNEAGDWLEPVPELSEMFLDPRGGLAESFDFLSRIPGAENRLFPGYGRYEASLDDKVRFKQRVLRGAIEREKLRELEMERREGERILAESFGPQRLADEGYDIRVEVEAARLTYEQLAAVKLALKTKRLPLTPEDLAIRSDATLSLTERYANGFSEIPLDEYYGPFFANAGFSQEILSLTYLLVKNQRVFVEIADAGLIDRTAVAELMARCEGDLAKVRTLYVFTYIDRHVSGPLAEDSSFFFNVRELYAKAVMPEHRRFQPRRLLEEAGLNDQESLEILLDFGRDFYEGIYRRFAIRFGHHLLKLANPKGTNRPKAILMKMDESLILGVAARDDRGIAASISGAFWKHGVGLTQAHLFSATNYGLVLNFFHLETPSQDEEEKTEYLLRELAAFVEGAIEQRSHCSIEDESTLPDVARDVTLTEWRHGLYRLRAESSGEVGALIYSLCCRASRRLEADIHGVTSQTDRTGTRASLFLRLPDHISVLEAREIVGTWG